MIFMPVVTLATTRPYPPRMTHFNAPFWQSLDQARLATTCCERCGEVTFPPRPICPRCWSTGLRWKTLSPFGGIYSYTIVHAAPSLFLPDAPYAVGIVDLDEGLRIALRILDPPEQLHIGRRGTVATLRYKDGVFFGFVTGESASESRLSNSGMPDSSRSEHF